jgi:hypothetical protein
MALTLKPSITFREGLAIKDGVPIQFEVLGMPPGEEARIGNPPRWQILHSVNNLQGEWFGEYESAGGPCGPRAMAWRSAIATRICAES